MDKGHRRALLLALVGASDQPLRGVVRLQKMLFLLEKEKGISRLLRGEHNFEAHRFGPYSREVYDDLEFLENLGLVESRIVWASAADVAEQAEDQILLVDYVLTSAEGNDLKPSGLRVFALLPKGRAKLDEVVRTLSSQGVNTQALLELVQECRRRYDQTPLYELIRYVYQRYPDYAKNSELKYLL